MKNEKFALVRGAASDGDGEVIHQSFRGTVAGRLPPHSAEAEERLLACCLIDGAESTARMVAAGIRPRAFHQPEFARVCGAVLALHSRGIVPDEALVAEELRKAGQLESVGGYARLNAITNLIPTTAHFTYFLETVRDYWILRELIHRATQRIEECFAWQGGKVADLVLGEADNLARVAEYLQTSGDDPRARSKRAMERMTEKIAGRVDRTRQLRFGLTGFEKHLGPLDFLMEDVLVVIAAEPSGGKSALMRQIVSEALKDGRVGMAFLLETSMEMWLDQCTGLRTGINPRIIDTDLRENQARYMEERRALDGLLEKQLFLRDETYDIEGIEVNARELKRKLGRLDFVVVDYLQLVSAGRKNKARNREEEVAGVARRLKLLGKELECTVIAAAQLNREASKDGRRPRKSDLRESGGIEQSADKIIAIHVPKEDATGQEQTDNQARVMVELCQLKFRNGPIGVYRAWFDRPWTRFSDSGSLMTSGSEKPGSSWAAKKAQKQL